jgi:hypothetical protein
MANFNCSATWDDPLNLNNTRSIHNTDKYEYNCGGYALGTFSWYCPRAKGEQVRYSFRNIKQAYEITLHAVAHMVYEFEGKIRMIRKMEDLRINERVVAFRISSDGDFHYIKKTKCGWYHKMGASDYIRRMSEYDVFNTKWCDRYDGPIVLLAIKKD